MKVSQLFVLFFIVFVGVIVVTLLVPKQTPPETPKQRVIEIAEETMHDISHSNTAAEIGSTTSSITLPVFSSGDSGTDTSGTSAEGTAQTHHDEVEVEEKQEGKKIYYMKYIETRIYKSRLTVVSAGVRAVLKFSAILIEGNITEYSAKVGKSILNAVVISNIVAIHKYLFLSLMGYSMLDSCVVGEKASAKHCIIDLGNIGIVGILGLIIRPVSIPLAAVFGVVRLAAEVAVEYVTEFVFEFNISEIFKSVSEEANSFIDPKNVFIDDLKPLKKEL